MTGQNIAADDLQGVVPPTITVFDEDEEVDEAATAAHAQFVVDRGCHGVVPLGTNGEFPLLTGDERRRVIKAVTKQIDSAPVVAGVGAPSTTVTVDHARHAEAVGADAVMVVTPYYYPLDHEAAVEHYQRVADAIDLPVYLYHIPSKTGNSLSLDTFDAIASIDGVAGLKDSSKDVPWLGQAIDRNPELSVLAGSDSLLFPGLAIGCAGVVSAVANVFPDIVVDLYEAYEAGNEEHAREQQSLVYDVRSALKRGPYMAGVKTALSFRDVPFEPGELRAPLRTMDTADRDALQAELDALGVLDD